MRDLTSWGGQRDVYSVGVAAKIIARLKQGDFCEAPQCVRDGKAGNAGADDGNPRVRWGGAAHARPPEDKNAAKRPGANEGGRREEERPGIASGP